MKFLLKFFFSNADLSGLLSKWTVELGQSNIKLVLRAIIKG